MPTETYIIPAHLAKTWDGTDESIFDWWDQLRTLDDALYVAGKPNLLKASYEASELVPGYRKLIATNPLGKTGPDSIGLVEARRGFMIMGQAGARPEDLANWSGWGVEEIMKVMFNKPNFPDLPKVLDAIAFADAHPCEYRPRDIRAKFGLTKSGLMIIMKYFNLPLKAQYHPAWVGETLRAKRKESPEMGATLLSRWFNENHTSPAGDVKRSAVSKMLSAKPQN